MEHEDLEHAELDQGDAEEMQAWAMEHDGGQLPEEVPASEEVPELDDRPRTRS